MTIPYKALSVTLATTGTGIVPPDRELPVHVTFENPALDSMTDLRHSAAITVEPETALDVAEQRMKYGGVRLLFVVDLTGYLLGLVTLNDIKGERPVRFQRDMGVSHDEILIRDIMTPAGRLEVISMEEVVESRVGDIIQTLKRTGRQHALVEERAATGTVIRGIFSATRIGRQLGVQIESSGVAWTFAELESALH
ncbi:MAG: CBS domain-containing protein [Gammaproteobacteria bacterium]